MKATIVMMLVPVLSVVAQNSGHVGLSARRRALQALVVEQVSGLCATKYNICSRFYLDATEARGLKPNHIAELVVAWGLRANFTVEIVGVGPEHNGVLIRFTTPDMQHRLREYVVHMREVMPEYWTPEMRLQEQVPFSTAKRAVESTVIQQLKLK